MKHIAKIFVVLAASFALALPSLGSGVTVIQGSGTASAINPFQFAGSGTVRVGSEVVAENSLTTLLALGPGPGSSLLGQSTHTLSLGSFGSIVTLDEIKLVPVDAFGLHHLSIRSVIVGGTGAYAGASGRLSFNGFANLTTGQVSWMVHGQID
jgi:hypothetical protein